MGPLRSLAAAAMVVAVPAAADPVERWQAHVAEAAARFGMPEDWIVRVMRAESGGRTMLRGRPITSRAGAMGLMQLMPATWAEMRDRYGLGDDPHDPRDNIHAGTAYLRLMLDRFGYPGLFAAYNAGPARYAAHLATGRALPGETRAYLAKVAGSAEVEAPTAQSSDNSIFFALGGEDRAAVANAQRDAAPAMFVTLRSPPAGRE